MTNLITLDYEYNRGLFYSPITRDVNEFNAYVKGNHDITLVGYNILVDLAKLGIARNSVKYIDVQAMMVRYVRLHTYEYYELQLKRTKNGKPSLKLKDVCNAFGIPMGQAHDPKEDAEATLRLYYWLTEHGVETIYNETYNFHRIWA
jgi:DNA polymerase III epsilon subunit-like protein